MTDDHDRHSEAGARRITILKLLPGGGEKWRYAGTLLRRDPHSLTIEARFDSPNRDLPGLSLRVGDRFVETHYADRWYNVFAVYDGSSGAMKGWYCNITRPARIDGSIVSAEDLALDLIVRPDGTQLVLDEDEFEAQELSAADRASALAGLEELRRLAAARAGPFRQP
jgi:hypothetical protein